MEPETPQNPFQFQPCPDDKRCTAKSKRTGQRCRNWAMRGKNVCKFHGGKSTGAKTTAGKEAAKMARLTHGRDALEVLKSHSGERIIKSVDSLALDALVFLSYFRQRIAALDYTEYRQARPVFAQFCKGEISLYKLISHLDGKPIKPGKTGLLDLCLESYPMLPQSIESELKKRRKRHDAI